MLKKMAAKKEKLKLSLSPEVKWSDDTAFAPITNPTGSSYLMGLHDGRNVKFTFDTLTNYINANAFLGSTSQVNGLDAALAAAASAIETTVVSGSATYFPLFVASSSSSDQSVNMSAGFTFDPGFNAITLNAGQNNNGATITLKGGLSGGSEAIQYRLERQGSGYDAVNVYNSAGSNIWYCGLRTGNDNFKIYDFQNAIDVLSIVPGAVPITTFSGTFNLSSLTASQAVATDSSKNLISLAYASANTVNALVQRNGSGNFSAGTITAALVGNSSTATALQSSRNINGQGFDGTTSITVPANTQTISTSGARFVGFYSSNSNGNQTTLVNGGFTFDPSTGNVTATTFTGTLSGNATSATTASAATLASNANNGATVSTTTNANYFPLIAASSSNGNQAFNLSDKWQFNPNTGVFNVGATQSKNGIGKLTITGANASAAGPYIETYTASDAYPLMQFFSFGHDNMCISFDCYFDNSINQISSSINSNFCIYKESNDLAFMYNSGIAAGGNMLTTRKTGFFLDTSGNLNLNNWLTVNNSTAPGSNPTNAYYVYAQSGALKGRGASGTITTIGPADPHCPVCEADFGLEWENEKYGHLQVCIKCLVKDFMFANGDKKYIRLKEKVA